MNEEIFQDEWQILFFSDKYKKLSTKHQAGDIIEE